MSQRYPHGPNPPPSRSMGARLGLSWWQGVGALAGIVGAIAAVIAILPQRSTWLRAPTSVAPAFRDRECAKSIRRLPSGPGFVKSIDSRADGFYF